MCPPERATDGSLQSEDWTLNMEICDIINETEEGWVHGKKSMAPYMLLINFGMCNSFILAF